MFGAEADEPLVWYEGTGLGDRRWLHADERGSVIAASDGSGNLVGSINRYDDYGAPQGGAIAGRFGYTGQVWLQQAGLYHYRARAYNPAMGRFMQTDPIGYEGGMNPYAYVGNNPVNFADPSGLGWRCVTQTNEDGSSGERCRYYPDNAGGSGGANIWSRGGTGSPSTDGGSGGQPDVNECAPGEISDNCVSVTGPRQPQPENFEPELARDFFTPASQGRPGPNRRRRARTPTCSNVVGYGYFCYDANLPQEDWCAIGRGLARIGQYIAGGFMVSDGLRGNGAIRSRGSLATLFAGGAAIIVGMVMEDVNCN